MKEMGGLAARGGAAGAGGGAADAQYRHATRARLHEITEAIVHLEGKADDLLRCRPQGAVRGRTATDPMAFIVGREVYRHLERVLDGFEDVADEIQGIVIDHA